MDSAAATATASLGAGKAETSTDEASPAWAAVVSLSLGVFGLVTAEFLPVSLLTPLAGDLGISVGAAGQAVTATAVVGAVVAPTMAIMTRGVDRRYVMWAFSLGLLVSNLIAAFATNFAMLLTARIILGVALGGFWSMAAAMAMRLVPMRLVPRAMSIILTGVSFATVSAAPIGAYIGDVWGWRTAFFSAAGVGLLALIAQLATLPSLPPIGSPSIATLLALLKRPSLRLALFTVLLAVSGHFAGFTYIRPLLEEVPMLSVTSISLVLLGFGIGGFFGNFAGAFLLERSLRVEVALGAFAIGLMAVLLILFGASPWLAAIAVTIWGFAFSMLPVGLSTWMVRAAPDEAEGAGGLLVATFQIAIASGALLGGVFVDGFGALGATTYAAIAALLGAALVFTRGRNGGVPNS
ncbi:MFS transporter [Aestuariivirga sp. YIM B02566]|uniref:MFS transporter n=1 Tax=Taklimakanibacter albus TaxID=2800327 RepID=A0ACC5RF99_9HYPH|nr:MFS transporter [Aestuariivirga sp. YIM B02566]MBK1871394.1 MFS transporter [Aestuariivirga sp. YIM B02566]